MLVDNFLKAITTPSNQPAFVHCASGNRAAALWMIKRLKWASGMSTEQKRKPPRSA